MRCPCGREHCLVDETRGLECVSAKVTKAAPMKDSVEALTAGVHAMHFSGFIQLLGERHGSVAIRAVTAECEARTLRFFSVELQLLRRLDAEHGLLHDGKVDGYANASLRKLATLLAREVRRDGASSGCELEAATWRAPPSRPPCSKAAGEVAAASPNRPTRIPCEASSSRRDGARKRRRRRGGR